MELTLLLFERILTIVYVAQKERAGAAQQLESFGAWSLNWGAAVFLSLGRASGSVIVPVFGSSIHAFAI